MADELSKRVELETLRRVAPMSATKMTTNIQKSIEENLKKDPQVVFIMKLVEDGKSRYFWLENGALLTKGS